MAVCRTDFCVEKTIVVILSVAQRGYLFRTCHYLYISWYLDSTQVSH